jgi:hypothetical protein
MYKSFVKYVVVVFFAGISVTTLPMDFKVSYDGEELEINGHSLYGSNARHMITTFGLSFIGGYLAQTVVSSENPNKSTAIGIVGSALGSVLADYFYGKATRRRIMEKTGGAIGGIMGALNQKEHEESIIKDKVLCGDHIGRAFVSYRYNDVKQAKLYMGMAIGEQLGMHLSPVYQEAGGAFGVNMGAAIVTSNEDERDFYLKKAVAQMVSVQMVKKGAERWRAYKPVYNRSYNGIADKIASFIASLIR